MLLSALPPRQRLQAKLSELLETVRLRMPEVIETHQDSLQQPSLRAEIRMQYLNLNRHDFKALQTITKALDRVDAGTYGTCERCQGDIDPELLSDRPWAARCLACEPVEKIPEIRRP